MTRKFGKLLLTGASGFVGNFVQKTLPCADFVYQDTKVDICDADLTNAAIQEIRPDTVLHLAAQTYVPQSFLDPVETFQINFLGTYNLLKALKNINFKGRFLLVSSSDIYGIVSPDSLPVTEATMPCPRSPYGVSKVAAEALCRQWFETEKFDIVIARPFNHIGPGQRQEFAVSGFAKQVAEIKRGVRTAVIEVGALDSTRDFLDVCDVVEAYRLLLLRGHPGETYNVCSGTELSLKWILNRLIQLAQVDAEIKIDEARIRPGEQKRIFGSAAKLKLHTGWEPSHSLEKTLLETLQYWERMIA